jgi:hypothetical protein
MSATARSVKKLGEQGSCRRQPCPRHSAIRLAQSTGLMDRVQGQHIQPWSTPCLSDGYL